MEKRVWVAIMRRTSDGFQTLLGLRGPECGNPNTWGLFGGGVDKDELVTTAAVRELQEETGLVIPKKSLCYMGRSDKPFGDKQLHWFVYGEGDIKKKDCHITHETIDYKWVTLQEAEELHLHYSAKFFFDGLRIYLDYPPYRAPVHSLDLWVKK